MNIMISLHSKAAFTKLMDYTAGIQRDNDEIYMPKCCLGKRTSLHSDIGESQQIVVPNKRGRLEKKRVRFADTTPQTCDCHHAHEDLHNAWYTYNDYGRFKIECAITLKTFSVLKGDTSRLDPTKISIRGLEDQLDRRISRLKKQRRVTLVETILRQQAWNRETGFANSSCLCEISERFSKDGKAHALSLGNRDRKTLF
jgi:ribosome-associated translation inhibitor RaiA